MIIFKTGFNPSDLAFRGDTFLISQVISDLSKQGTLIKVADT
jgi:hypothetical protein